MAAAVKLRLVKGATLQRLVVLVLLSLAGLGHPPNFCEAIKCYCQGGPACNNGQVDCSQFGARGCNVIQGGAGVQKGCDADGWFGTGPEVFKCVQDKVGGSGNCVEGPENKLIKTQGKCVYDLNKPGPGGGPGPGGFRSSSWNDSLAGRTPGGAGEDNLKICTCRTDLCNSDAGALGGVESLVTTGMNVIQGGITGLIIIWLWTNGLFF